MTSDDGEGPIQSPARRAIWLVFYLLMIGVGSWATYEWLLLGGKGIAFKAGCFLAVVGICLVWMDFVSPNRGRQ